MKKIMIIYIPILHNGYLHFLKKHRNVEILYLPDQKLVDEFMPVAKEIRQIDPETMRAMIESAGLHHCVRILERKEIPAIRQHINRIVTANDSISLGIADKYFPETKITVDSIFLRWDEKSVYSKKPISYGRISTNVFDREMMSEAGKERMKSSDWWRQVGAVIVKDGKILLKGHNRHVPSEHTPYTFGDPRDFIEAGKNSELSSAIHAEQSLIAEAARRGIVLEGTDIYVTVFPCPVCAKMIAYSGIKGVFFSSGHASLDGETILKAKGVELIFVK